MYRPDRIDIIFDSASKVGLPVWAGFSSRNKDGLIALTTDYEYSFKKMISNVKHHKLDAVGIMHCDIGVIEESIKEKKDLQKIILCDIQNDIYPKLEKILLNLLSDSGYSNVKFDKKVDFNKLFNDKFN